MNIKDYLHLYLGCELLEEGGGTGRLFNIGTFAGAIVQVFTNCSSNEPYWTNISNVKPILRPLSDMTEEEKKEYNTRKQRKGYMAQIHADNTLWLLSKHFDLFNLHKAGLCLYKNEKGELY